MSPKLRSPIRQEMVYIGNKYDSHPEIPHRPFGSFHPACRRHHMKVKSVFIFFTFSLILSCFGYSVKYVSLFICSCPPYPYTISAILSFFAICFSSVLMVFPSGSSVKITRISGEYPCFFTRSMSNLISASSAVTSCPSFYKCLKSFTVHIDGIYPCSESGSLLHLQL